ncbi:MULTISPECIES: exopolyphosphatase [Actinosynnema]|uniref:Ppx/GppA phosphatase family protein n=1 Tax=Actinosynnema TaxID=40566 RepID=UPI0020A3FC25|nr:exopolyphosphatase [Actinosynnema pretiosum]MCP2098648.1 exopolyphosphatase / guanosine-5'-triphosphate,3'-diphosphate pyrophosphatase [Actinosynnema pretiosum]
MAGRPGRAAVLDIGCFSAHLVVVEGSPLNPVLSHKTRLRLDRALTRDRRIGPEGVAAVCAAVRSAASAARQAGVSDPAAFATSVIRDAANAREVLAEVRKRTGVDVRVLPGEEEARLAYVAARNWFGFAAGPLLVLDVGGGTVEVAAGSDAAPSYTRSFPLGARTVTRGGVDRRELDRRLRAELAGLDAAGHRAVGCSKVFQQLARLSGARPQHEGPLVRRALWLEDLRRWSPRLAGMPASKRARLPGISRHRAEQSAAGAAVAEALMAALARDVVEICPWSTKEGLLLERAVVGGDDGLVVVA